MRSLLKSGFIVAAVLILFAQAIWPLDKQLRLGKDLRGGVSMVYSVDIGPGEDAARVLADTIDVLKRRVDPDGLLEVSMVAQGRDRIEITMPLPNDKVKRLRADFEKALAELGRARLTAARIDETMAMAPDARAGAITALAGQNETRSRLLNEAAAAYDRLGSLNAAYNAEQDPARRQAMVPEVASARIAYESARDAALATALSAADIRKIVQSSTRRRMIDDVGGARVELPSAREVAEAQLRAAHPEAAAEIDRLLSLHKAYASERTTLDDPNDLIRMLRGAGVLSFRITVRPGEHPDEMRLREEFRAGGPRAVKASDVRWYRINQIDNWLNNKQQADMLAEDPRNAAAIFAGLGYVVEPYAGDYYMLAYDTRETRLTQTDSQWRVTGSYQTADERGRPAIAFNMDPGGALGLSRLTGKHVGQSMAILLDDEVYTAPNLIAEIGARGQIVGDFPAEELNYIIRVLSGGSLQAKLSREPISISAVGPELGADNLEAGFRSGIYSVILVAAFMIFYYFLYGAVAVVALAANAVLILGAMALSKAAFTMPGIAGVILTFGMAVDSNVLIYERIREERNRGADMKTAVRLGFDRALAAIVDGNVTNLIVCVVLYYTGTPEIRGFAVTMGIGVVATLFAALVVSRFVFDLLLTGGWGRAGGLLSWLPTSMLPTAFPALQRWLTPNVDWLRLRYVFFGVSALYMALGIGMVLYQGQKMLDNEFRGGTQITLQFKDGPDGEPVTMTRPEVVDRVQAIAGGAPENMPALRGLRGAEIFPVDPAEDGVTSDRFVIKTVEENRENVILDAVRQAFSDKLESQPALRFEGSETQTPAAAPAYPIEKTVLGENIGHGSRQDVSQYMGGVVIVLRDIEGSPSLESLRSRLEAERAGEDFSDTLPRRRDVLVLEGSEEAVRSAAVVVADETASVFDNEAAWESEVRDREWALVQNALTRDSTPASVFTFSPSIASTFRANAATAAVLSFILIGVYIWIRFKTPRYSIAAVVALVHDVVTVIGLVALAEILYENESTHALATSLNLLPFKIDLNMVAALLTIAGYSLNDTVVIMDRIRENRGKLPHATRDIINTSINQTFSRTLITGGTTLGSCIILYFLGGEGMRAFAFALATGLVVGTYSSIAVAAPIVWSRKHEAEMKTEA